MHTRIYTICISIFILFILLLGIDLGFAQTPSDPQQPSTPQGLAGTAFTYQGKLNKSGTPVDVACDFQFTLYNAASGGSTIGTMQDKPGIGLTNGYFTVTLDFGSDAFNGDGRWLGILVKCPPDEAYTDLGRQQLTPAPLALALPGLWTQQNLTSPNIIGGYSGNTVDAGLYGATISGGGFAGSTCDHASASSCWNRVTGIFGTIGGGSGNTVGEEATVGGGKDNSASAIGATIGGGWWNHASSESATVGGGAGNKATQVFATVAGGAYNEATGSYSFVGSGYQNHASGFVSAIAGGWENVASGDGATVAGGGFNIAAGIYSFAAGHRAKANHAGAFVWGDSTDADIASTSSNQFLVRANGGVTLTATSSAWRFLPNATSPNLIGGHSANSVTSGVYGATISGGGLSITQTNRVTDHFGMIGGGFNNQAGNADADVNNANSATVSGGAHNQARGWYSTIPGGINNVAAGNYSFAAGKRAKANHQGTFVWGDSTDADVSSTAADQVLVRANGGVTLTATSSAWRFLPNATSPNLIGGYSGNSVTSGVYGATISGGGKGGSTNLVTDHFGTVGGGEDNQAGNNDATLDNAIYATVGGGISNTASDNYATVGGGNGNNAGGGYTTIGGGRINTANGYHATVAGGESNEANGNRSFVGGGTDNHATNSYATISGGYTSSASGEYATIGGGKSNTATSYYTMVGGGFGNDATNSIATISGGQDNLASGGGSTVGGGFQNTASGLDATVPGGYSNLAQGSYSLAVGNSAKAFNQGCFVWGDATGTNVSCNNDNRWVARASGGVYFYTNAISTTGVYVSAGSGTWSQVSDRKVKANVKKVDPQVILENLAQITITTWNYKSQDDSIRHIGPMAQDFYAAFEVGENDTHITTIDADGVALAAIQGLYAENQQLTAENADQQAQIEDLEARLAKLEKVVKTGNGTQRNFNLNIPWLLSFGLVAISSSWVARHRSRGG